jgi:hypothetical protein
MRIITFYDNKMSELSREIRRLALYEELAGDLYDLAEVANHLETQLASQKQPMPLTFARFIPSSL